MKKRGRCERSRKSTKTFVTERQMMNTGILLNRPKNFKDITGQRFVRLTVIEWSYGKMWRCVCDCGTVRLFNGCGLRYGSSKSCGCLRKERAAATNTKHGQAKRGCRSPEYKAWQGISWRCSPSATGEPRERYYDRGIYVAMRWMQFENFMADMGARPSAKHSLDRIDNDGPYAFWNCRWAEPETQQRNKGNNRIISFNGKSMTATEWGQLTGIHPKAIIWRLNHGWDMAMAITEPGKQHFARTQRW